MTNVSDAWLAGQGFQCGASDSAPYLTDISTFQTKKLVNAFRQRPQYSLNLELFWRQVFGTEMFEWLVKTAQVNPNMAGFVPAKGVVMEDFARKLQANPAGSVIFQMFSCIGDVVTEKNLLQFRSDEHANVAGLRIPTDVLDFKLAVQNMTRQHFETVNRVKLYDLGAVGPDGQNMTSVTFMAAGCYNPVLLPRAS
jgi:hypothetical protein